MDRIVTTFLRVAGATLGAALLLPASALAAGEPAGGAATGEVVGATLGAALATSALIALGIAHRRGRTELLQRTADWVGRQEGIPGWAALPGILTGTSLLLAVFGMYWDISLHIDNGRDAGPLANPAHYFILFGLFGIFASGWIAIVLPREKPSPTAIKVGPDWYAPLGGIALLACGAFSLSGFPLDDLWHRLFGQDVTLWGPTHLMLITGASLATLAQAILLMEARRASAGDEAEPTVKGSLIRGFRAAALVGGLLVGLSTFQGEFDFGVPQFRLVFHPVLLSLAAAAGLVYARVWGGRGMALTAAVFALVLRGVVAVLVGPVLGETTPHPPIYLVEAVIVELVALRVGRDRPLVLGAICGALIGTAGVGAQWLISQAVATIPWNGALLPEALIAATIVGVGAGLVGAWSGAALHGRRPAGRPVLAGALAVLVVAGWGLATNDEPGVRAQLALDEVRPAPERHVAATVRIDPPQAARDAEWLNVTAWQGGGLVVDRLERIAAGLYRTTKPIPVYGEWKATLRLHKGRSILGTAVYLPADAAIPAEEVPAVARAERPMIADKELLQREAKTGQSGWLWGIGYATVAAMALALAVLLAWALNRIAGGGPDRPRKAAAPARTPSGVAAA
jgi:hypothetical protein